MPSQWGPAGSWLRSCGPQPLARHLEKAEARDRPTWMRARSVFSLVLQALFHGGVVLALVPCR